MFTLSATVSSFDHRKAYAMDRSNIELGVAYMSLVGDKMSKKVKLNFFKALWARRHRQEHDPKILLQCCKEMARLCHELSDLEAAASVM